ncbi:NIF family HAD-type phosphatase [Halobacteriovorax sp. JY17]|uniref:NIF family HAD-type phosphatase n=1 Tax=Halobacteriovorax sp. JY17 TaxID=2014617 RepID=UPI0025BA47FB|nr:NIF family HAD-type phosphatase [Halobacteriovorax sp. JY17]
MNKVLFLIFLVLISYGCANSGRAPASRSAEKIDIIFDLDWTLVKQVDTPGISRTNFLEVNGEFYRLGDGAIDLLEYLFARSEVRVSFFSGGKFERNSKLLKKIKTKYGSAFDNAHKVLSYDDLLEVSTDVTLAFSERLKKDVSLVNKDLSRVLLIDDDKRFIVGDSQRKNLLWMGETYKHFEEFSDITNSSDVYSPKTETKWLFDRKKLYMIKDILSESLDDSDNFLERVGKESMKWNFLRNTPTLEQRQKFLKELGSNSCSGIMEIFLIPRRL